MLLFTDPRYGPCEALVPDLARWQKELENAAALAVVSRGKPEENRARLAAHGLNLILVQKDREIAQSYSAAGTPSAVLVRADGTIGSGLAQGAEQIRALVAQLSPAAVPAPPSPGNGALAPTAAMPGEPVPAVKLPDLAGETVDLAEFRGRDTMLLFWNPGCGLMLAEVKALETRVKAKGPRLVLVSTGTVEANRASGFRSPVLLNQSFAAGRARGVSGTPSALLVDRDGKIASGIAVGAPAVLELAASCD